MSSRSDPDDAALWQQIRGGDEQAFARLYRLHARPLHRFAIRLSGSPALAEDVLQDVFVALVDAAARPAPGGYDPGRGPLRSYLYGAVRNGVHKRLRDPAGRLIGIGLDTDRANAAPREARIGVRTDDDRQSLLAALRELDPAFREVVILCELEGLRYDEAAEVLGVPIGTIRSRLARARARLLATLSDDPTAAPPPRSPAADRFEDPEEARR